MTRQAFWHLIKRYARVAGVEKVLWGTDDPFETHTVPTARYLEMMRALSTRAPAGYEFSQEEVDLMLGGSAAALMGLK